MKEFMGYYVTQDGELYHKITGIKKYTWINQGRCKGYERTQFWIDGKKKNIYVHRLMAMLYLPGWDNDLDVNHIDGNSLNNHIENLELCAHHYNLSEHYWLREYKIKGTNVIMKVGTVNAIMPNALMEV